MRRTVKYNRAIVALGPSWDGKPSMLAYAELFRRGFTWDGQIWHKGSFSPRLETREREVATVYVYSSSRTDAYQVADSVAGNITAIGGVKVYRRIRMAEKVVAQRFRVIVNFYTREEPEELPF